MLAGTKPSALLNSPLIVEVPSAYRLKSILSIVSPASVKLQTRSVMAPALGSGTAAGASKCESGNIKGAAGVGAGAGAGAG